MTRRTFLLILGAIAAAAVGFAAWTRRSFQHQIDREIAELLAADTEPAGIVQESDLQQLPEPVQAWLRASGVVGTAIPSVVRIRQAGEFRLGADEDWMPYHATQYYTTNPPGFLWNATMRMAPLIDIDGRDRYTGGVGDIEMRIGSVVPVATASGGDLNSGALLRYLNEMMWFPAALVGSNVRWEPVDDTHARATLTDAGQSVSAVFAFDAQHRLIDMTAARWNDTEELVLPWSTPIDQWGVFNGIEIATGGAGVWKTGPDAYTYIRLHLTEVEYDPSIG
ncbi:MAG: hypothetical protein KC438_06030 [Thermomicrobiales bacterium]|nr:hypothetical protein [Thermomicrobiales bacterium]MCO5221737.1 hypothetical protein [Thermomicrobiales bacterium]